MLTKLLKKAAMTIISNSGNTCTINGITYTGSNISITNGKVTIDGIIQTGDELQGVINVVVNGNIESLENVCGDIVAHDIGSVTTQNGDIECDDVSGSITSINGDINCGSVGGSISSINGDIRHK